MLAVPSSGIAAFWAGQLQTSGGQLCDSLSSGCMQEGNVSHKVSVAFVLVFLGWKMQWK